MKNVYALLTILQDHAPTGNAQNEVAIMLHVAQKDGATVPEQEKILAQALVDGLTHGNWPWVAATGWRER